MNLFDVTVPTFARMLANLDAWLGAAVEALPTAVDELPTARLAPDMYTLTQQVQSACDAAKFCAQYLSGQPAPVFPDTETSIAELRARIAGCRAYLATVTPAAFDGAAERRVSPPWLRGAWLTATDYALQVAIPNFFFHVVTAYAILRHRGAALGKAAYIGELAIHAP